MLQEISMTKERPHAGSLDVVVRVKPLHFIGTGYDRDSHADQAAVLITVFRFRRVVVRELSECCDHCLPDNGK